MLLPRSMNNKKPPSPSNPEAVLSTVWIVIDKVSISGCLLFSPVFTPPPPPENPNDRPCHYCEVDLVFVEKVEFYNKL